MSQNVLRGTSRLVKNSVNQVADSVGSVVHSGHSILDSGIKGATGVADSIVNQTHRVVRNTTSNVGNLASSTVRRVGTTVGRTVNEIGHIGADAIDTVHGFATDTIDGVGHVARSAVSGTIAVTENIIDSVHNVGNQAIGSTKNIVSGTGTNIDDLFVEGDTFLGNLLKNSTVSYGIKFILIIYISFFGSNLSQASAMLMDSTFVRFIIAALIILFATHDPIISLLIVIAFLISLQTANRYKIETAAEKMNRESFYIEQFRAQQEAAQVQLQSQVQVQVQPQVQVPQCNGGTSQDNNIEPPTCGSGGDNIAPNCKMNRNTQVLQGNNIYNNEPDLTQLQTNDVPGANQDSCVQSWKNQQCTQGLNCPSGSNVDQLDDQYASITNHTPPTIKQPETVAETVIAQCSTNNTEQECNKPGWYSNSSTSDQCIWKDNKCTSDYYT